MNLEQLKDTLSKYFENTFQNYAIAINGAWGSGKTYFWINSITDLVKERKSIPIYLSVGSIQSMEEFEKRFVEALLLNLNKDISINYFKKTILQLCTWTINRILSSKIFSLRLNGDSIQTSSLMKDLGGIGLEYYIKEKKCNNVVFCIDDLERTQLNYDNLFSYLDSLIQRTSIKIIVLVNESTETDKSDYFKKKEKLIRHTYYFEPNYDEVFETTYKNINNSEKENFLKNHELYITTLFNEYKLSNIRTFLHFIDTLLYIFSHINKSSENNISLRSIILLTIIVSNEFKEGSLTINDANDYKKLDSISLSFMRSRQINYNQNKAKFENSMINQHVESSLGSKHNYNYADSICRKYLETYITDYFFYPSIYQYILTGYLDKAQLNKDIDTHTATKPAHKEVLDRMISFEYGELESSVIHRVVDEFLRFLQDGYYTKNEIYQSTRVLSLLLNEKIITNAKDKILECYESAINDLPSDKLDNYEVYHEGENNLVLPYVKDMINKRISSESLHADYSMRSQLVLLLNNGMNDEDKAKFRSTFSNWDNLHKVVTAKDIVDNLRRANIQSVTFFTTLLRKRYYFSNVHEIFPNDKNLFENIFFSFKIQDITTDPEEHFFYSKLRDEIQDILKRYGIDVTLDERYLYPNL